VEAAGGWAVATSPVSEYGRIKVVRV